MKRSGESSPRTTSEPSGRRQGRSACRVRGAGESPRSPVGLSRGAPRGMSALRGRRSHRPRRIRAGSSFDHYKIYVIKVAEFFSKSTFHNRFRAATPPAPTDSAQKSGSACRVRDGMALERVQGWIEDVVAAIRGGGAGRWTRSGSGPLTASEPGVFSMGRGQVGFRRPVVRPVSVCTAPVRWTHANNGYRRLCLCWPAC